VRADREPGLSAEPADDAVDRGAGQTMAFAGPVEIGVTTRSIKNRTLSRKPNKFSDFYKRTFVKGFRLNEKS
jgi:hypothetical protein